MKMVAKNRDSNLELFRIITMILITANHYVCNSGLLDVMNQCPTSVKSIYLYLLGMWGKTGINCFVLITGYFMCRSRITLRKFTKLLLWVLFYNTVIYFIFLAFGYCSFSLGACVSSIWPVKDIKGNFVSCFFVFFLTIPFLNILIRNMTKRQHLLLLGLCLSVYTLWAQLPFITVYSNYVVWFGILYLIASYIRIYRVVQRLHYRQWGWLALGAVLLASLSVVAFVMSGHTSYAYFFVTNSNAILAVAVSVCAFMFFKAMPMRHVKWVNAVGASTFGVLLIHTNNDMMHKWLWQDLLNNVGHYQGNIYLHSILSILGVFMVCSVIDQLRLKWIERPLFKVLDTYMEKRGGLLGFPWT